jgi:hypothetical protein
MGFEAVLTIRLGRVKATVFSMSLMITSEKYARERKPVFEQRITNVSTFAMLPAACQSQINLRCMHHDHHDPAPQSRMSFNILPNLSTFASGLSSSHSLIESPISSTIALFSSSTSSPLNLIPPQEASSSAAASAQ